MGLFGKRQEPPKHILSHLGDSLAALEAKVLRLESAMRGLEQENESRHVRVLDWMKRAERAERRAAGGDAPARAMPGEPTDGDGPPRSVLDRMLQSTNPRVRAAAQRRLGNGVPNARSAARNPS